MGDVVERQTLEEVIGDAFDDYNASVFAASMSYDARRKGTLGAIATAVRSFLMSENEQMRVALSKIMPINVHNGPDYAEVYFGDGKTHSTQAMTMHPQDWLDLQAALSSIAPVENDDGRP